MSTYEEKAWKRHSRNRYIRLRFFRAQFRAVNRDASTADLTGKFQYRPRFLFPHTCMGQDGGGPFVVFGCWYLPIIKPFIKIVARANGWYEESLL